MARVYMRQTRAGQGGPLALVSMYQGRSHRRGVGTRAIMMPPGPAAAAAAAAPVGSQAGSGHWALATAVASTPSKAGPPQVSPGSSDTAVGCDGGSNLRARALGTSRDSEQPFVDKCKSTYQSQLEVFPRAWHGRRPATHRPSPGPPHGVGEAGLVGVAGRLPGNPCVMAVSQLRTGATPRIRGQPRWRRRGITTAWGRGVDRAPGCWPPGRNVLRTAPRQHATARGPPSGPALAQRAGMRTPCALGGTCARAVSSFGRQRTAVPAICSDGRFVAGAAHILSECRPQPWALAGWSGW